MAEVPVRMALPAPRAEQMSLLVARLSAVVVAAMGGVILFAWQLTNPSELGAGRGEHDSGLGRGHHRRRRRPVLPDLQADPPARPADWFCSDRAGSCRSQRGLVRIFARHRSGAGARRQRRRRRGASRQAAYGSRRHRLVDPVRAGAAIRQAGQHPVGVQPNPGADHPGSSPDRAGGLRLRRRDLRLSVPLHPDVALWREHGFPACARAARRLARIWHRRRHRRAVAGRRDAAAPVARHPGAAAGDRLVRPSGRDARPLR